MKFLKSLFFGALIISLIGCGAYSFTGISLPPETKTFQVNYFENYAGSNPGSTVEPGLERDFKIVLEELILNQTSLDLVKSNGDLVYEGEITEFRISPMTSTANNTAAQNRLTIGVMVRFFNRLDEESDFEQRFSFYYDYPGSAQLVGSQKDTAIAEIFERITQDIVNKSLANW
jgi:hypothetical protein